MKICGIIAEYNPFHNGHAYQISKAREITGCDCVVVCMSGDFVQRGEAAITDKYLRSRAALKCGADLVIELPVAFATASAELFAYGGVSILSAMGCDYLCFGSEMDDIEKLITLANAYDLAEKEHMHEIKDLVKGGKSYAKAIEEVLGTFYKISASPDSNDKLAIAYIRAINKLKSSIKPISVKRIMGEYLDTDIESCSALAIRTKLSADCDFNEVSEYIPKSAFECLFSKNINSIVLTDDFSDLLYMKIAELIDEASCKEDAIVALCRYSDVSGNIAGKIVNSVSDYVGFSEFADLIHSAEYTKARMQRSLIHILLNITDDIYENADSSCYIRILGFKKNSGSLLSEVKNRSSLPIVSKLSDSKYVLDDNQLLLLNRDIFAANLYEYVQSKKEKRKSVSEYSKQNQII